MPDFSAKVAVCKGLALTSAPAILLCCLGFGAATPAFAQTSTTASSSLPEVQAYASDAFVDSMGVNTHMTYGNTPYYNNWPTVLYWLQQLSIRHIRDAYYDPTWGQPLPGRHQQLAESKIHTDYILPNLYFSGITPQTVEQLKAKVGDMEMVEFPNECDEAGNCGATAASSLASMLAFAPTVTSAGELTKLPVLGPAMVEAKSYASVGDLSLKMTYNNLHIYYAGRNPGNSGWGSYDAEGNSYGSLQYNLDMAHSDGPSVPVVASETGYMNFAGDPKPDTIPADIEASYIGRTLALNFLAGIKRTYVYELLDEVNSPGYGIIDSAMKPKPAYYEIQNLIANFSDPGESFTPGKLPYRLTGGDSSVKQLLLGKRDGSFWMLVWVEKPGYDPVHCEYTAVPSQTVTLTLGGNYHLPNVGTFDGTGHVNWISTHSASQKTSLTISDQISILKILP